MLYGHGADPHHLLLSAHDFAAVLRNSGTNAVLTLTIEGTEQFALTKALDIHPIRRNIQHADLLVVRRGEKVTVDVNVIIEGEAVPGALVTQDTSTIQIEAEALSIPEQLTVSVEGAEEGTQILAGQVQLPNGVTLVSDPDMLVVNVVTAPTAEDRARGRRKPPRRAKPRRRRKRRAKRPTTSSRWPSRYCVVGLGNPGAGLRQDPAQPRVHGGRPAGGPRRARRSRRTRSPVPTSRPGDWPGDR